MSAVAVRLEDALVVDDPADRRDPQLAGAGLIPDELVDDGPTDLGAAPSLPVPEDDDEGLLTEGGLFAVAPLSPSEGDWSPTEGEADDEPGWRPDSELVASLRGDEAPTSGPGWRLSDSAPEAEVVEELSDAALSVNDATGARYGTASAGGDLEALLLETENLRLRRELHEERRLRVELEGQLGEVRARAQAAEGERRDWKDVAAAAEARLRELEWKLAHYQAFAEAGLWARLRGCPPFRPAPLIQD